jgi:hypothetical protein
MVYQYIKRLSIMVNQKQKRGPGRPKRPGGRDPVIAIRVRKAIVAAIDIKAKREGLTRSKAAAALLAEAVKLPVE